MTRTPPSPLDASITTAEHRVPSQERGAKRVESILDAAAELVKEVGIEGLTVQTLADRAATSKGSLYHFFPDVPAVLRALAERHLRAIASITDAIVHDEAVDWRALSPSDVVTRLLAPLDYLDGHADLMALIRAPAILPRSARAMETMINFTDQILAARSPHMNIARRKARAAMLVAVIDGSVGLAGRGCSVELESVRRELEELLVGYVATL